MWPRVASIVVLFLVACSHGALEPGAGNDPGVRTGSLIAGGNVIARPLHANVREPTELTSTFQVVVTDGTGIVRTGSVTVTSATGTFPLAFFQPPDSAIGYWTGTAPSYDEVYALDVVVDAGMLRGVRVDGPDIHVFTEPEEGAVVDATMPLTLAWERDEEAEMAMMQIDSTIRLNLPDAGDYSISPELLAIANENGLTQHTLRIGRSNRVMLATGTVWSATVVNEIDVVKATPP
jgi:hypothetical protein